LHLDVAYQGLFNSTATIYAKFNGNNKNNNTVIPGCALQAFWPYNYGDIYFGADNCLYDSDGKSYIIFNYFIYRINFY
jgi:hypothetical protein